MKEEAWVIPLFIILFLICGWIIDASPFLSRLSCLFLGGGASC